MEVRSLRFPPGSAVLPLTYRRYISLQPLLLSARRKQFCNQVIGRTKGGRVHKALLSKALDKVNARRIIRLSDLN